MIYKTLTLCAICIVVICSIVSGKVHKSDSRHDIKRSGTSVKHHKHNSLRHPGHDAKAANKLLRRTTGKKLEKLTEATDLAPSDSASSESDSVTQPEKSDASVQKNDQAGDESSDPATPPSSSSEGSDPATPPSSSSESNGLEVAATSSSSEGSDPATPPSSSSEDTDPETVPPSSSNENTDPETVPPSSSNEDTDPETSNDASDPETAALPSSNEDTGPDSASDPNADDDTSSNQEDISVKINVTFEAKKSALSQRSKCNTDYDIDGRINAIKKLAEKYKLKGIDSTDADLNKAIKDALLNTRGVAQRASHALGGDALAVPAGVNLGGHCVLTLDNVFLFFHRMKLRNSTAFTLKSLKNDLKNMVLNMKIGMNDIHLLGSYEKMLTDKKAVHFFYHPTFGIAEFLLKGVDYKLEARYRTATMNRINVEIIVSSIKVSEVMLELQGSNKNETKSTPIKASDISTFLARLKTDMDEWIKDFINDALNPQFSGINEYYSSNDIMNYDQEKSLLLNNFAEDVIKTVNTELSLPTVLPNYSITSVNGMVVSLQGGQLLNLNTLYRRSTATINKQNVEVMIAFANPKIVYRYSIKAAHMRQSVNGYIYYSANDISGHMTMSPEGILTHGLQHLSSPVISIQGAANPFIASYRHLLEHQILAIFTNVVHNFITTFVGCVKEGYRNNDDSTKKQKTLSGSHIDPTKLVVSQIIDGMNDFKNTNDGGGASVVDDADSADSGGNIDAADPVDADSNSDAGNNIEADDNINADNTIDSDKPVDGDDSDGGSLNNDSDGSYPDEGKVDGSKPDDPAKDSGSPSSKNSGFHSWFSTIPYHHYANFFSIQY